MSALAVGQELVTAATALDQEGAGICPHEDVVVHLSGALPGERVRGLIEHLSPHRSPQGQRRAFGRALQILQPSPQRVAPACPAQGRCGGCPVQHLRYEEQLLWKQERVRTALAGEAALAGIPVQACLASPRQLGYRNQGKYVYGWTPGRDRRGGQLTLGAYAPRTHDLVDLLGCQVVEPVIDQAARALRDLLVAAKIEPFHEIRRTGILRYVVLRSSSEGQVLCTLVTGGRPLPGGEQLAAGLRAAVPAVVGVLESDNDSRGNVIFGSAAGERTLSGAAQLIETMAGLPVALGPRAFLQLNHQMAAQAYAAIVRAVAGLAPLERVVDLYAGLGGIGLALAGQASEVIAVEDNPAATEAGTVAARAGAPNLSFVTASAETAGPLLAGADLVVLNPPRAGAARVAAALAGLPPPGPRAVVYLSCNPDTLARDLALLIAPGRLRVEQVQPLDMLPHTPHVEALVVLKSQ